MKFESEGRKSSEEVMKIKPTDEMPENGNDMMPRENGNEMQTAATDV
jgi:hypothetical protein